MNATLEKFKDYLIPVLSIGVVVVLVFIVIIPQLQQIADSSKVINTNQARLATIEDKADKLENLKGQKDTIKSQLNIAESALPIEKNIAQLVLGVQQVAINSGLKVATLKIQPGKTATASAAPQNTPANSVPASNPGSDQLLSSKETLIFELNLTGSLANYESFLKSLETAKRILTISEFKTTNSPTGPDFNFDVFIAAPFGQLPKLSKDQIAKALPTLTEKNLKLLASLQTDSFKDITSSPITPGPIGIANPFK